MPIQISRRRECGGSWVTDVSLNQLLTYGELAALAERYGGRCRQFYQLAWLDFPGGRITASLRLPRLTIRMENKGLEAAILADLQQ